MTVPMTADEVRVAIAHGRHLKGKRGRFVSSQLRRQIDDQKPLFSADEIAEQRRRIDELND